MDRLTIENYYLPIDAYESASSDPGSRDFAVHKPELSPAPDAGEGEFWEDHLKYPPAVVVECIRTRLSAGKMRHRRLRAGPATMPV